ncbi:hypothetical protein J3F83DRAFT_558704 [Trichoderma novae-zelandiae]
MELAIRNRPLFSPPLLSPPPPSHVHIHISPFSNHKFSNPIPLPLPSLSSCGHCPACWRAGCFRHLRYAGPSDHALWESAGVAAAATNFKVHVVIEPSSTSVPPNPRLLTTLNGCRRRTALKRPPQLDCTACGPLQQQLVQLQRSWCHAPPLQLGSEAAVCTLPSGGPPGPLPALLVSPPPLAVSGVSGSWQLDTTQHTRSLSLWPVKLAV